MLSSEKNKFSNRKQFLFTTRKAKNFFYFRKKINKLCSRCVFKFLYVKHFSVSIFYIFFYNQLALLYAFWEIFISFATTLSFYVFFFFKKILIPFTIFLQSFSLFFDIIWLMNLQTPLYMKNKLYKKNNVKIQCYYIITTNFCMAYIIHKMLILWNTLKSLENHLKIASIISLIFFNTFFPAIIIIFYKSARICSVWKKFRELSGAFVGKQGLSLKQQGKIYQCCDRPVLLSCCERWELTVMDEVRSYVVEHCVIKMM